MKEICENIIDIVNNSIGADASKIEIEILEKPADDLLCISITDNGTGMDSTLLKQITDPFYTTRKWKKTGMGIPLLQHHAELSGGRLSITSRPGEGTKVTAYFGLTHIDRQPLGDIAGTLLLFLTSNPEIHFVFQQTTSVGKFTLDSLEIQEALGGIKLNRPEARDILKEYINNNLEDIDAIPSTIF